MAEIAPNLKHRRTFDHKAVAVLRLRQTIEQPFDCETNQHQVEGFVFQLGDVVDIVADGKNFQLKFELVEGSGQFLGHFMRGNRPSQIADKAKERFTAFDAQIFLRTIRREASCTIKATLKPL
ncbi:MAG TPA: hypothetical protein PLC42_07595, partial [Parachlamydiaceae bacterium]|nr:hypothetical protein [Parachlamydiaceae bacterium]